MTKKITDKDLENIDGGMDEIVDAQQDRPSLAPKDRIPEPPDLPGGDTGGGSGGTEVEDDNDLDTAV